MEKDCKELLEERVVDLLKKLESLTPGTEEYKRVESALNALYELKIKEDRAENEIRMEERKAANEEVYHEEKRQDELRKEKRDTIFKWIGVGTTAVGGIGTFAFNWIWHSLAMEFEKTGTFVSKVPQFVKNFTLHKK